jgi:hypothetical protein
LRDRAGIDPEQARDFARALGGRAKTDAIGARMLAEFGRRLVPRQNPAADPDRERDNESGPRKGKRSSGGGRGACATRSTWPPSALPAPRPDLRAFYKSLRDKAKPPNLTLIACPKTPRHPQPPFITSWKTHLPACAGMTLRLHLDDSYDQRPLV